MTLSKHCQVWDFAQVCARLDLLPAHICSYCFSKVCFYRKVYRRDGYFLGSPRPHSSLSPGYLMLATKEVTGPALGSGADMSSRATGLLGNLSAYHLGWAWASGNHALSPRLYPHLLGMVGPCSGAAELCTELWPLKPTQKKPLVTDPTGLALGAGNREVSLSAGEEQTHREGVSCRPGVQVDHAGPEPPWSQLSGPLPPCPVHLRKGCPPLT